MAAPDPYDIDPLERLLNLVALLLDARRPMTFDEISDAMEGYAGSKATAKRKFERDKDVLRAYGVPIEMEAPDPLAATEGYVIRQEDYYLPEIEFTPAELTALFVAAQGGTATSGASRGVRKLLYGARGGELSGSGGGPLVSGSDVGDQIVGAAAAAAASGRRVRFRYRDARGALAERTVDAYGVVLRRAHWYLVGHDHDRGQIRAFRLSRIDAGIEDDGEGGPAPPGFSATDHVSAGPWEAGDDVATVAFSEPAAVLAMSAFTGASEQGRRGDEVILRLPYGEEGSMASLLLGYGPDAVVIAPEGLRARVVQLLRRATGGNG
jgi:proteasome accessory factor B